MAAKKKAKAGKQSTKSKKVVRKQAPAPKAPPKADQQTGGKFAGADKFKGVTFPCLMHVKRGADNIPAQVTDQAHLDRLITEHGHAAIEVAK